MRQHAKFWSYVSLTKKAFPTKYPVSTRTFKTLRCRDGSRLFGDCCLIGKRFHIRIARCEDQSVMIDVFWHELAHALVGVEHGHKRVFWDQYAKIYRHFIEQTESS